MLFMTPQITSASENLFPSTRKIIAEAIHPGLIDGSRFPLASDPASVQLHSVSGGFNCVIEISANRCLRQITPSLSLPPITLAVPTEVVQEMLSRMGRPSRIEDLNSEILPDLGVHSDLGISIGDFDIDYFSILRVQPIALSFSTPNKVNLVLKAELRHFARITPKPSERDRRLIEVGRATGVGYAPSGFEPRTVLIGSIGDAFLDFSAGYEALPDAPHARVEVILDHFEPPGAIRYSSDTVQQFFKNNLSRDLSNAFDRILSLSGVKLTPTLSLTGSSPSYYNVTEFSHFEVSVFHVETNQKVQAIVAAFDVMPGCHGSIEDVEHFIGNRDYGVITDEYVVERVFSFKWRIGGFDRTLNLKKTIEVARNGKPEDATLKGYLELLSLDVITFSTDSDTRRDYIRLGGQARAVPTEIVLSDGTVVGPDQVDFGDPESTQWGMATSLTIIPDLSSDPEVRQFQQRAHSDAYRHIARPFAHFAIQDSSVVPEYTRLEAVSKYLFVLGQLPLIF